ncbi:hypothetical protein EDE04_0598 [Streptomyces sp. 2132.2]|uniref:DUF5666 domain-containing protein n=1 Tax=Streptomyces sp. 2132.2 TaxID=2485161 RepID=UPI000F4A0FFC|nr:DUF5666 domain-containing protein [Streptomyces sp. 2132.2]ROQ94185.1 hypothetical protein EDE04_0598 [Streptomyces sp. 2132.2]
MARRRTEPGKQSESGEDRYAPFADVFTASAAGEDPFPEELIVEHPVAPVAEGPDGDPEGILAEPPDTRDISAELAAPPRPRLPWLTLVLSGGVVAGLAFTGGALVEKGHLQGTPGAGAAGRGFAAGTGGQGRTGAAQGATGTGQSGGRQGFGGATGGPGAGAGVTTGTVKLVDGTTLYVTDAAGGVVKVTTDANTQITQAKSGKVSDLQPGQTVTVRGSQNSAGDLAATTVAQGGAGGFGGAGGGRG